MRNLVVLGQTLEPLPPRRCLPSLSALAATCCRCTGAGRTQVRNISLFLILYGILESCLCWNSGVQLELWRPSFTPRDRTFTVHNRLAPTADAGALAREVVEHLLLTEQWLRGDVEAPEEAEVWLGGLPHLHLVCLIPWSGIHSYCSRIQYLVIILPWLPSFSVIL